MSSFEKLVSGYRSFKATEFEQIGNVLRHHIALNHKPSTLFVTSCSLQIAPDTLTASNPGDLYVVRNLGGFVPPYDGGVAHAGVAAIKYAVVELEVENIIVLGHTHCDGVHMLMDPNQEKKLADTNDPIAQWLHTIDEAKDAVCKQLKKKDFDFQEHACEQEAVLVSLKNLIDFPFVKERIEHNNLGIFGWHLDIETGLLSSFNPETRLFESLE